MKTTFLKLALSLFFAYALTSAGFAQKSPKAEATSAVGNGKVTIAYSQPSVKGREIWGKLVPYDKVWRTGADEATTIEFAKDATVEGKKIAAGKYSLFTIPTQAGEWTVIFNKTAKQWGAYDYKEADDALRVKVKSTKSESMTEKMTFTASADGTVTLLWENMKVSFKVTQ
jgi:hypothetical protein